MKYDFYLFSSSFECRNLRGFIHKWLDVVIDVFGQSNGSEDEEMKGVTGKIFFCKGGNDFYKPLE